MASHWEGPLKRQSRVNLRFKLPYMTVWGQNLMISGSDMIFGNWNIKQGIWMTPHHEGDQLVWQAHVSVPEKLEFEYKFCVVDEKINVIQWEEGEKRRLLTPEGLSDGSIVDILDQWQDGSSPQVLYSRAAFKKIIFQRTDEINGIDARIPIASLPAISPDSHFQRDSVIVRFRVSCGGLRADHKVLVSGSTESLGLGRAEKAISLTHTGGISWEVDVSIPRTEFPLSYRYLLKDGKGEIVPEQGDDIELALDTYARKPSAMVIVTDGHFRSVPWKAAGIAMPVFSIQSRADVGVGEFLDLKLLVDLAVKSGLRLVQVLPVNDTSVYQSWRDSYPYSSLSVFALHPLYLRLQALSNKIPRYIQEKIDAAKSSLSTKQVDYEGTMKAKLTISKELFHREKEEVLDSLEYKKFFDENQEWLRPYGAFCFLRDLFGTADHSQWGVHSQFSVEKLEKLVAPTSDHYAGVAFWYYLQFHLYLQLREAAEYARKKRVLLKGDLPIGVGRYSVDTWQYPTLFRMDTSTGAPPDAFSKGGQNWGFPTYNWEEMAIDNYGWWRSRLTQMEKFFSAYRIDHIIGFFRIWELPEHAVEGIMGHFRPCIPISAEEMEVEGVWDFNRLSDPYIRTHLLQDVFKGQWQAVAAKYMDQTSSNNYMMKEEFNTEKKVAAALEVSKDDPEWIVNEAEETLRGLTHFLTNVCLMRSKEDPRKFYPRFNLDMTSSYLELDDHHKELLKRLALDYFYSRQESLWHENALKTLPVLMNSCNMMTCGEDLGLVPACVEPVLHQLGILGLRIQRLPTGPGKDFNNPADYEYPTVCAPSCHDTTTMRAWWEDERELRQRFYQTALKKEGPAPASCTPEVAGDIIKQHLDSPSMWAIFPIQDILALKAEYAKRPAAEETINDPSNPHHYWRFRIHKTLDEILEDSELNDLVREMVSSSGRDIGVGTAYNS